MNLLIILKLISNRPRSIYQYSNMAPRLSGQTSIFGVAFFVPKSLLGIERQKKLEKFAILIRKPRSHAWILIYRTWPIPWENPRYLPLWPRFSKISKIFNVLSKEYSRKKSGGALRSASQNPYPIKTKFCIFPFLLWVYTNFVPRAFSLSWGRVREKALGIRLNTTSRYLSYFGHVRNYLEIERNLEIK